MAKLMIREYIKTVMQRVLLPAVYNLSKKKTVDVRYPIGFERMVRAAIKNFEKMGLRPVIYRDSINSMGNRGNGKKGKTGYGD